MIVEMCKRLPVIIKAVRSNSHCITATVSGERAIFHPALPLGHIRGHPVSPETTTACQLPSKLLALALLSDHVRVERALPSSVS